MLYLKNKIIFHLPQAFAKNLDCLKENLKSRRELFIEKQRNVASGKRNKNE